MIKKIISGGQTGADRAALDVAIQLGIPHGGWIPKGRKTENGELPEKYRLKEMPTDSYPARAANNVLYSDGTLLVSHGVPADESALTPRLANIYRRPWLHIDLNQRTLTEAAGMVKSWIRMQRIKVLNVTGPSLTKDPRIYQDTVFLLKRVFKLLFRGDMLPYYQKDEPIKTTADADLVDEIISQLPLKDRVSIANMDKADVKDIHHFFNTYIRGKIEPESGGGEYNTIMNDLWERLREAYRLRIVK